MLYGPALAARIPWVSERQLGHWCRQGYVIPMSSGSGRQRVFSDAEGKILIIMARLVQAGLIPEKAASAARALVAEAGMQSEATVVIGDGLRLTVSGI